MHSTRWPMPHGRANINWTNPITKGLAVAAIKSGSVITNMVNGERGVLTGTQPTNASSSVGEGFKFTTGSFSLSNTGINANTGDHSIFAVVQYNGVTSAYQGLCSVDLNCEFFITDSGSGGAGTDGLTSTIFVHGYTLDTGVPNTIGYSRVGSSGTFTGYHKGVVKNSAVRTGDTWSANSPFYVGVGQTGDDYKSDVYLVLAFNRILTGAEFKSLNDNPWQVFLDAGDAGAFAAVLGSGAITLTGANAQQVNRSTSGAFTQIRVLTGANAQQVNHSTSGAISRTLTLTGANAQQVNHSTSGAITLAIPMTGDNSQQVNHSTSGAFTQIRVLTGANSQQVNHSTSDAFTQIRVLTGANAQQVNHSTSGAISIVSAITLTGANAQQVNHSTSGAITQTRIMTGAPGHQVNHSTSGQITRNQAITGAGAEQINHSASGNILIVGTWTKRAIVPTIWTDRT